MVAMDLCWLLGNDLDPWPLTLGSKCSSFLADPFKYTCLLYYLLRFKSYWPKTYCAKFQMAAILKPLNRIMHFLGSKCSSFQEDHFLYTCLLYYLLRYKSYKQKTNFAKFQMAAILKPLNQIMHFLDSKCSSFQEDHFLFIYCLYYL